jgi:hypothetical protein
MALPPPSILQIEIVSLLRDSLRIKTFVKRDSQIILVCGAQESPDRPNPVRKTLLEYARKYFASFRFFLAEDVIRSLKERKVDDWLTIEDRIGDFSDAS